MLFILFFLTIIISGIIFTISMINKITFNEIKTSKEITTVITGIMFIFIGITFLFIITTDVIKLISEVYIY